MSNIVVIMGESGTGKSTSMRNLNPNETFLVNVLGKPLPFRGFRKIYNKENKNYLESDKYISIKKYIQAINDRALHIKTIVIDDFNFIMQNEFMRRSSEKKFDKFVEIGYNIFDFLEFLRTLREDLTIYLMCHTEKNDAGFMIVKTIGKMTAEHVGIEKRVTIVLHTQTTDGRYKFLTQTDGFLTAKSPMGMFDIYIDNDLNLVNQLINEYYEG